MNIYPYLKTYAKTDFTVLFTYVYKNEKNKTFRRKYRRQTKII